MSATGTRGFTLIEILAVVAITGIILAVAAVNLFPSDAQVARRESGMVALALERARDTAWFGGRPTAISFDEGRMREWRLAGESWQPDPARDRALADDIRITGLFVDGQRLEGGDRLVFLADGLGIPFRVAMEVRGLAWAVEGDAAGSITLAER
jgi:prepilin-type N-terminal cleavage/methylation domain-containing protein